LGCLQLNTTVGGKSYLLKILRNCEGECQKVFLATNFKQEDFLGAHPKYFGFWGSPKRLG
jgi:hypothetical protein